MKKYEYKTEFYNAVEKGLFKFGVDMERLEGELNDFGKNGWALCGAFPEPTGHQHWILIFRREVSG